MTLPAELNGGNGEAMNGVLSELPDTAGSAGDNAGLSVPPVSPGGPESGMHGKVGTLEPINNVQQLCVTSDGDFFCHFFCVVLGYWRSLISNFAHSQLTITYAFYSEHLRLNTEMFPYLADYGITGLRNTEGKGNL